MPNAGLRTPVLYGIITEHRDHGMVTFAYDRDLKRSYIAEGQSPRISVLVRSFCPGMAEERADHIVTR